MQDPELEKKIEYTKIMLEEYRTLRSEIINKQSLINNIVNFSFAIIGANLVSIANVVVKQKTNNECEEFIVIATALFIPFICGFAIIQYYLEFIYTARISRYIVAIEDNINTMFGKQLLFWESGIREWESYQVPQDIYDKIKQLREFMWIKDKFVKKLLILPTTFCIIAAGSGISSMIYSITHCQNNNLYIYHFIFILFAIVLGLLWRQLAKIVNEMHWSTMNNS
ncbi:MAG: hypothetical protein HWQ41_15725 [Nostoc sp. NOS(2021)]|uniref:hypothetical protein n=1 Tax=Nostoc sp. NOS(2021) TaxID=2815407 RepID=UPI0025E2D464|nr:hypothetical protein [Nostoc sp. NOS(2021)]MBN3896656.1 hypothetical protein [Nostoc sp. NOS(2021)]